MKEERIRRANSLWITFASSEGISLSLSPLTRRCTGFRPTSFISSPNAPIGIFSIHLYGSMLITGSRESNADVYWRRPPFVETAWGAVRPTCPMNLRTACTSRFMSQLRASINCILSRFDFLLPATRMYSRITHPWDYFSRGMEDWMVSSVRSIYNSNVDTKLLIIMRNIVKILMIVSSIWIVLIELFCDIGKFIIIGKE